MINPTSAQEFSGLFEFSQQFFYVRWGDLHDTMHATPVDLKTVLNSSANGRHCIINTCGDPTDIREVVDHVKKNSLSHQVTVLVNDQKFQTRYPNLDIRFFPAFVLQQIAGRTPLIDTKTPRAWRLSSHNRRARPHRVWLYYLLRQRPWSESIFLTFGGWDQDADLSSNGKQFNLELYRNLFDEAVFEFYHREAVMLPRSPDPTYNWEASKHYQVQQAGFVDSYFNIVSETSKEVFCPTEKTYKPLQAGCLIMAAASANHLAQVAKLGFDFNYQGFDHNYETDPDWKQRITKMVEMIDQIYNEIPWLWQTNLPRIRYNQELFHSTEFLNRCCADVNDLIQLY